MSVITRYVRRISPGWLRGTYGAKLVQGVIGLVGDAMVDWMIAGIRSAQRVEGWADINAADAAGRERGMRRYANETRDGYLERLRNAWTAWEFAGTKQGILDQFTAAGYPNTLDIYTAAQWPLRPVVGWISQWFLFFPVGSHNWSAAATYGPTSIYGASLTYGITAPASDIDDVRAIISDWKAGHEVCREVIVELGGFTYGTGKLYGASGLVYGPEAARFKGTPGAPNA